MELHNLKPAKGSVRKNKRLGRGEGSGSGDTAARGHKGQKSRSGYSRKRNFEGGQMPLQMRLPKRGFKNPNRKEYVALNLDQLQEIADKHSVVEVNLEFLKKANLIKKTELVKILGRGELQSALQVEVHAVSEKAKASIEAKGGSVTIV